MCETHYSNLATRVCVGSHHQPSEIAVRREYACFNTIFEISCSSDEIILFESARYGRNDSAGSAACGTQLTRSCDIDVQYSMSRACGGRRRCSIAVNMAFFGDPCGYEEFLNVLYRCIPSGVQFSFHGVGRGFI